MVAVCVAPSAPRALPDPAADGKSGVGFPNLEWLPFRAGIPVGALSGYEKFEGPDPAALVARGYACVNADQRGVWDSEGDFVWNSTQEGRDGADLIEWIGTRPWCTGKVGMAGNSWCVALRLVVTLRFVD